MKCKTCYQTLEGSAAWLAFGLICTTIASKFFVKDRAWIDSCSADQYFGTLLTCRLQHFWREMERSAILRGTMFWWGDGGMELLPFWLKAKRFNSKFHSEMSCAHGLAWRSFKLWVTGQLLHLLWSGPWSVASLCEHGGRPSGRLPPTCCSTSSCGCHNDRGCDDGRWFCTQCHPSSAVGVGVQTGKTETPRGKWTELGFMDRSRSLGQWSFFKPPNAGDSSDSFDTRKEDEVCSNPRPRRRIRIPDPARGPEGCALDGVPRQNRWTPPGTRRTDFGATLSAPTQDGKQRKYLCRLFGMVAIWEKSSESTSLPHMGATDGRLLPEQRSTWPLFTDSVARLLPGVQSCSHHAQGGDDGNPSSLRGPHREVGSSLWGQMLAFDCGCGRPWTFGSFATSESSGQAGDHQRHEGSSKVGRRLTLGSSHEALAERPRVLERAGAHTCRCLVGSWSKGRAKDTFGDHCICEHPRGRTRTPTGNRRCEHVAYLFGTREECTEDRCEKEKTCFRSRGTCEIQRQGQGQGGWQGQRKGQRKTTALLRLEQQQWGLCWLTTRTKLPRKNRSRTPLHQVWKPGTSITPMLKIRLIDELKRDWSHGVRAPFLVVLAKDSKTKGDDGPRRSQKDQGGPKDKRGRDHGNEGTQRGHDDEEKATFEGRSLSLRQYLKRRRFHFLHHYAGPEDPLSEALKRVFRENDMKIQITACEKKTGVDLLSNQPYNEHCEQAKKEKWDGFHSGFPCTTFSVLRWNKKAGYPGPVRSRQYPYGLPSNSKHRQEECDEGTLHASRSAYIADLILEGRKGDRIKPAVTLENPPEAESNRDHLPAWDLKEVDSVVQKHNMAKVWFPTCYYQPELRLGKKNYKPQMFKGTLMGLGLLRGTCSCGVGNHEPIVGKTASEASGKYPSQLCDKYAELVLEHFKRMATVEFYHQREVELRQEMDKLKETKGVKSSGENTTPGESSSASKGKRKPGFVTKEDVDKTAAKKVKPKPNKEEEYSYTYESEEEEAKSEDKSVDPEPRTPKTEAPRTPPTKRRSYASPPQAPKKQRVQEELEWKGGSGQYGMLGSSRSKASDPSRLVYVGGMRNPAEVVQGMPSALSLGLRIFASWEKFTKSHPEALETAAAYGTKDCTMSDRTVDMWRAELRKVTGSRGKKAVKLTSKWEFQSPLVSDIFESWGRKMGDVDTDLVDWIDHGVPLGINLPISSKGVFPANDRPDEEESTMDALAQLERGTITNYLSVKENQEDAKIEIDRLLKKGIAMRATRRDVETQFSQGTISRLALIVKERADKTKKRRLIIDLRRSGGNSKAKLEEKLVLPRMRDGVVTIKDMHRLKGNVTMEDEAQLWRRELLLIDVSDAFPHLGVHGKELEHCVAPDVSDPEGFLVFRAMLFGFKTAPLLWSRLASWVARALQSAVPLSEARHQVYLDDSFWVLQGTLARRNLVLGFILHSMRALGLEIALTKGERGDRVTWAGVDFKLEGKKDLLLTLPEKFLADLEVKLNGWDKGGMAGLKELRGVTGKISWLSGVLPRARWILRVFYSVLTAREAEIRSGQEEQRRGRRQDARPKEHLFAIKRLERARLAMLQFLKVAKDRPTRKISLLPTSKATVSITTDASPEGLGAILVINGQMIEALHSKVTEGDAKDLEFELGASSSQGIVEALALVVAIDKWGKKLAGLQIQLTIQSDSVTALSVARKLSAASPALNCLGATLALLLEKYGVEDVLLQHVPGVANGLADYLSRPSCWATTPRPAGLEGKEFSLARPRVGDFYPLPVPGRKPELWGSTNLDDEPGAWLSWLWK